MSTNELEVTIVILHLLWTKRNIFYLVSDFLLAIDSLIQRVHVFIVS